MSKSAMMATLAWLHTQPVGAPSIPAIPEAITTPVTTVSAVSSVVSTETAASKPGVAAEVATVSAMPDAPPANLRKPQITRPVGAPPAQSVKVSPEPVNPLREARVSRFRNQGIPAHQAERIADILAERDYTLDDRRACAECASFHDGRCLQGRYPVGQADVFTLHRCAGFKPDEVPSE